MKVLNIRSSSLQIRPQVNTQRPPRAKSTHSQQSPLPSSRSERYELQDRQKNLTEGKAESKELRVESKKRKEGGRYRLTTSVKSREKQERWSGVKVQRLSSSKDILQEQKVSLAKLEQLRNSMEGPKLITPIRYRTSKDKKEDNSEKQRSKGGKDREKEVAKVKPRLLHGYIEYICGSQRQFSVGFDYSYLRRLSRAEAKAAVDFNAFAILESVQLCALDILEGESGGNQLLREYGLLFLRQFQKNLTEVVLATHYFRLAQRSIFLCLLHARLFFILLIELASEQEAVPTHAVALRSLLLEVVQAQRLLYNGRSEIDKQGNYIAQTFRVLKVTSEIEKLSMTLFSNFNEFTTSITSQYPRLRSILAQFAPLQQTELRGAEWELLAQTEVVVGWKYFGIPPIPFLPPSPKVFTLVLSLEGVLVHYDPQRNTVICRPYLQQFLTKAGALFELVVFSSQPKPAADQLIAAVEQYRPHFAYRLYKEHLSLTNAGMTKDLSKLGRQTECVLMVDCKGEGEGIWRIGEYTGSRDDKVLLKLERQLLEGRGSGLEHIEQQEEQGTIPSIP